MLSVDMVRLPNLRCLYICLAHLVLGSVSHHGSIFASGAIVELGSIMELGAVLGSGSLIVLVLFAQLARSTSLEARCEWLARAPRYCP